MAHTINPSSWESEAGEFQDSQELRDPREALSQKNKTRQSKHAIHRREGTPLKPEVK